MAGSVLQLMLDDMAKEGLYAAPANADEFITWLLAGGGMKSEPELDLTISELPGCGDIRARAVIGEWIANGDDLPLSRRLADAYRDVRVGNTPLLGPVDMYFQDRARWDRVRQHDESYAILPGRLGMAPGGDRRLVSGLFQSHARVRPDQPVLPGFMAEDGRRGVVTLPLELLEMGGAPAGKGKGAPLSQRLFVETILATPLYARNGKMHRLECTLRDLLEWCYPRNPDGSVNDVWRRPRHYWPLLERAMREIEGLRLPIEREDGRFTLRRLVSFPGIPDGPEDLDGMFEVDIHLPMRGGSGPRMSPNTAWWGQKDAVAWRLLLNLPLRDFNPGGAVMPKVNGHFIESQDPAKYTPLGDGELLDIAYPPGLPGGKKAIEKRARKAWGALRRLAAAGEIRLQGKTPYPPKREGK